MRVFIRLLVLLVTTSIFASSLANAQGAPAGLGSFQQAREVHQRRSQGLFKNPRVVATGVGISGAGKPVIKVYIESGSAADIPAQVDGIPVEVSVSGRIVASRGVCNNDNADPVACRPDEPRAPPGSSSATDRYPRPVPIGVSTGHTNITAGTIGCSVKVGCHKYALSNNHVFADEGAAVLGDDILQPGPYDGGTAPADVIGTLYDFEPIIFSTAASNTMDAALIATNSSTVGVATLGDGYGLPRTSPIDAVPGMDVMKYGRTTGFTSGTVDAVDALVNVGYDSGIARFIGQIIIRPGSFSAAGDSGSLIVVDGESDDRRPVGLLFAGSNTFTVANPIAPILLRFGASIEGE
jgi:hypothetical protein